jgi:hypothetical protein
LLEKAKIRSNLGRKWWSLIHMGRWLIKWLNLKPGAPAVIQNGRHRSFEFHNLVLLGPCVTCGDDTWKMMSGIIYCKKMKAGVCVLPKMARAILTCTKYTWSQHFLTSNEGS